MHQSIAGNFYDLLHYVGAGHYGKMRRCFQATLNHFGLSLESDAFAKYRWRASHFLNTMGLLEIDVDHNIAQSWSSCPGYIVTIGLSQHRCVGGTTLINAFIQAIGDQNINLKPSGYQPTYLDVSLFPAFPETILSPQQAQQLARDLNCLWVDRPAEAITKVLPPQHDVSEKLSQRIDSLPDDPDLERIEFDQEQPEWQAVTSDAYIRSGLLRRRRHDRRFDHFAVVSKQSDHQIYRINSNDWSQFIALDLLGNSIKCHYQEKERILSIPKFLQLPILLQRVLVTTDFSMPEWKADGLRHYRGIPIAVIDTLTSKYPCLTIVRTA